MPTPTEIGLLQSFLGWIGARDSGPAPEQSGTGRESEAYEFEDAPEVPGDDSPPPRNGYAASIAFVAPSGKVLFVRRSSTEKNWPDTWSLPGGRTEEGETPEQTAQREAREEIGDCSFDGMSRLETKRTPHDCEHTSFLVPAADEFEPTLNGEHTAFVWASPAEPPEPIHPGVKATLDGALARCAQDVDFVNGPGKVFQPVANLNRPLLVQEPKAKRVTPGQLREERRQLVANVAGGSRSRMPQGMDAENPPDVVSVDVPLLIRLMEYAREDAPDDEALHVVTERIVAASGEGKTLSMADYDGLTGQKTSAMDSAEKLAAYARQMRFAGRGDLALKAERRRKVLVALDAFEESKHPRDHGKFSSVSGGSSKPKPAASATEHAGEVNLADHGLKPKGRAESGLAGAAQVAWYTAKKENRNVTAVPGGMGWKVLGEISGSVPYGQAHIIVTPDGIMHKFLQKKESTIEEQPKTEESGKPYKAEYAEPVSKEAAKEHVSSALNEFKKNGFAAAEKHFEEAANREKLTQGAKTILWHNIRKEIEKETGLNWREAKSKYADKGIAQDRKTFDADGRLHAEDVPLTKANVCEYLGREIPDYQKHGLDPDKKYKLYRHPDELKKAVKTFNRLPVLSKHVPVSADSHLPDLVVGATGSDARWDPPYVRNSISIWPRSAIDRVESGKARELSSAYQYEYDPTPGKTPEGESYDGVMRKILGNHIAQVEEGRVGPDVAIDDLAALQWAKLEGALRALGVKR